MGHESRPSREPGVRTSIRSVTHRRRRFFILIALLLPFFLALATELGFRWAGFGGYPPVLQKVGPVAAGTLVLADHAGAVSWFFANPNRPGYNEPYTFVTPKPTNTFRVFTVGESTMKGYPQPRNLASSSFLQAMLSDVWPHRNIEVINLGTTAVASYPVLGMLKEAVEFEPDLVIIHTGHNEFFGTYGVASIGRVAAGTWSLPLTRFIHSLGVVQAFTKWRYKKGPERDRSLMEIMVGESYVAPDSPMRMVAQRNLHRNIAAMVKLCREREIPVIVCTLPSNERDLAPIGRTPADHTGLHPTEIFATGQRYLAEGNTNEALKHFLLARDLDPMPWRAPSEAQEAIRCAAKEESAILCDLEQAFRANSRYGCVGWELMDDHVHPTLRGQALMAEMFVHAMTNISGTARLTSDMLARIRPWHVYADELGRNPYDEYGVAHSMRVLFNVPFMRSSNPSAYDRFDSVCTAFEQAADPEMLGEILQWQTYRPHAGARRPLSGMMGRVFMRQKRYAEALTCYEVARKAVPPYTSWHMEYTYFGLVAKEKINGGLSEADRAEAMREIDMGNFLLRRGFSNTGFTERYIGRLHQLRGEFAEAIPYLLVSRSKLSGVDLVAADQALVVSYLHTQQSGKARELIEFGIAHAGQYADYYKKMLAELPAFEQAAPRTSATNAAAFSQ